MLKQLGFSNVIGVGTGKDAFSYVSRKFFDVIFVDLNLPDFKGSDVVARIRKARPEAKIIMLIGNTDKKVILECMEAGAIDMLAKPVQAPVLKARMEKYVHSSIPWGSG
jgi:DNA-binding response OmpR family regulator